MITLIRWFMLKQKEIKFKLALYSFLGQELDYITEHKEEVEQKFMHELIKVIHTDNHKDNTKKNVTDIFSKVR